MSNASASRPSAFRRTQCASPPFVVVFALMLGACASPPRSTLRAPDASSPPEKRLSALKGLLPVTQITETEERYGTTHRLELANNTVITDPRDLLAVVPAESTTAKSAHLYAKHRRRAIAWRVSRYACAAGTVASLAAAVFSEKRKPSLITAGVFAACSATAFVLSLVENKREARMAELAFQRYPHDLLTHLGLKLVYDGPRFRQRGSEELEQTPLAFGPQLPYTLRWRSAQAQRRHAGRNNLMTHLQPQNHAALRAPTVTKDSLVSGDAR